MKKYNIETVYNYINGEDITDFTLEELIILLKIM